MARTRDARVTASGSEPKARRGRLDERAWADVLRAAKVAREAGVALTVHGVHVAPFPLKQPKGQDKHKMHKTPKTPVVGGDSSSPRPPSKRQQKQAQRLEEFHEKKRQANVAAKVAAGVPHEVAVAAVAREEQKRIEAIAKSRAEARADAARPAPTASNGANQMQE